MSVVRRGRGRNQIRIHRQSKRENEAASCWRETVKGGFFSVGHELFSNTSLFPSSVVSLSTLVLVPFPPTEEHCHRGSGAKGKSVSLKISCISLLPLSTFSTSVWLSLSLSSFLKCCFFKVSPNNSALELYFASLFMFTWTICVLWFKVLVSCRQTFLIFFLMNSVIISRQGC